jgi:translation initiation factor IF-2
MGHVDHGKTTLLDAFRTDFNKCKEEFGAITQSIGAFTIQMPKGIAGEMGGVDEATFIDTPGHEAFQNMRARGAKVTDMIILVVSAVESIQKQTLEVIELAKASHIPMIVAINKIDRPEANL